MGLPLPVSVEEVVEVKTIDQALSHVGEPLTFNGANGDMQRESLTEHKDFLVDTFGSLYRCLKEQIEAAKTKGKTEFVLRYTMTLDKAVLFAGENGFPNQMPHFRMTGEAQAAANILAAGNLKIKIRDDGSLELLFLNHKSGDFWPDFNSVRWILAALVFNQDRISSLTGENGDTISLKLSTILSVDELWAGSGGVKQCHQWALDSIITWVTSHMANEKKALTEDQPKELLKRPYDAERGFSEAEQSRRRAREDDEYAGHSRQPPARRALDFTSEHSFLLLEDDDLLPSDGSAQPSSALQGSSQFTVDPKRVFGGFGLFSPANDGLPESMSQGSSDEEDVETYSDDGNFLNSP